MTYTRVLVRKGGCFFAFLLTLVSSCWAADAAADKAVQLTIKNLQGGQVIIKVPPGETVRYAKGLYEQVTGIPPERQRFVIGNMELQDDQQLLKSNEIHCIPRLIKLTSSRVTALGGALSWEVDLFPLCGKKGLTVGEVSEAVYNDINISADKRRNLVLACNGQVLSDNHPVSDVSKIGPLELRLKNGAGPPPPPPPVPPLNNKVAGPPATSPESFFTLQKGAWLGGGVLSGVVLSALYKKTFGGGRDTHRRGERPRGAAKKATSGS